MKSPTVLPGPGIAASVGRVRTWLNVRLTPIGSIGRLSLVTPFGATARITSLQRLNRPNARRPLVNRRFIVHQLAW